MITNADIKKLTNYQLEVFKDVFSTKEDHDNLVEKVDKVQAALVDIAKDVKVLKDEKLISEKRLKSTEDWIDKASPKLGLELGH